MDDHALEHDQGNWVKQARRGASPLDPIKGAAFEIHSLEFGDEGAFIPESQ